MDRLLEDYDMKLRRPECFPEADFFSAVGIVDTDLSPVIPYLNSVVKGATYISGVPCINFNHEGHGVSVQPAKILVAKCYSEDEAERGLDALVELINDTWARRDEIEPSEEEGEPLTALEVFCHLPGHNCGDCGEPTCMAFATKLLTGEVNVGDCSPLFEEEADEEETYELVEELAMRGHEVPEEYL